MPLRPHCHQDDGGTRRRAHPTGTRPASVGSAVSSASAVENRLAGVRCASDPGAPADDVEHLLMVPLDRCPPHADPPRAWCDPRRTNEVDRPLGVAGRSRCDGPAHRRDQRQLLGVLADAGEGRCGQYPGLAERRYDVEPGSSRPPASGVISTIVADRGGRAAPSPVRFPDRTCRHPRRPAGCSTSRFGAARIPRPWPSQDRRPRLAG
jgi:hypothetical protein